MLPTKKAPAKPQFRTTHRVLAALALSILAWQPAHAEETKKQSLTPLPDLNTVEECQRISLSHYLGGTFRFHRGECWADVSIDTGGEVISFIPDDEDACKRVLSENCGWVEE